MGFLKRNPGNSNSTTNSMASTQPRTNYEQLTEADLEAHLQVARYGDFQLTDAVRPSYKLDVVPQQGYRRDSYRDSHSRARIPVLMAAASAEILFELFLDLLDPLGDEVDVVLDSSHATSCAEQRDLYRENIDLPVLKSLLYDFEDLLLNDGCTGIAVLNPHLPQEIQFDEHKLLIVYGQPLVSFERILRGYGLDHSDSLKFITEAEHVHSSQEEYARQFEELKLQLGIDEQCHRNTSFS
ncbi:MAG: hypothetical protein ACKPEY_04520 [Planctomycetota bacterium]